jgi:uncharacterized membrane protein YphA (DoxX/SURF4 family)
LFLLIFYFGEKVMFLLIARLLLAFLFVFAGVQKLLNFDSTSGFIDSTIEKAQVPFYADASKEVADMKINFGDTLPFLKPAADASLPDQAEAMIMKLAGEKDYFSLPDFLTAIAIFIELIGGILIILGFATRFFAVVIFLFLIPVNVLFHGFWNITDAVLMQAEMMNFIKNLAIMGGLLALAVAGPGGLSLSGGDSNRKSMEDDI